MNSNYQLVAIRNIKDGTIRSPFVTDSLDSYIQELRSFLHKSPDSAYAMFADSWELIVKDVDYVGCDQHIPFTTWVVKNENS